MLIFIEIFFRCSVEKILIFSVLHFFYCAALNYIATYHIGHRDTFLTKKTNRNLQLEQYRRCNLGPLVLRKDLVVYSFNSDEKCFF